MNGLCQCGCHQPAPLILRNDKSRGHVKGQPFKFIAGHQRRGKRGLWGPENAMWKGGRSHDQAGYVMINVGRRRPVQEHIIIAERALGRRLPRGAQVHHFNEIKDDNRNTNLVVCQDQAYHSLLHTLAKVKRAGGTPFIDRWCSYCRRALPRSAFGRDDRCLRCRECNALVVRERRDQKGRFIDATFPLVFKELT